MTLDYKDIQKGDMPGDKINIDAGHVDKAKRIMPELMKLLGDGRTVISVHGGSGVGKSEIGALIGHHLRELGIGTYILSGDNYPHRIPRLNDAERVRVFRESGIKGLVACGEYTPQRNSLIQALQRLDMDSTFDLDIPWLKVYHEAGRKGLQDYLGTHQEIDFDEVNSIIDQFKSGKNLISLKRMGREEQELWYDSVDFSDVNVLIIEWTHGNNGNLVGVDIPILLNSTPEETLAHRKARNRDGATDSAFTKLVLEIEQELLRSQAHRARLIVTKAGELIGYETYEKLMAM